MILNEEPARLAHMPRYAVRGPVAEDRVRESDDGTVILEIPPDPRTGDTVLPLHPLEYLRRMTNQIPDAGSHTVRYYIRWPPQLRCGSRLPWSLRSASAYSNRLRSAYRGEEGEVTVRTGDGEGPTGSGRRASWARLRHQVFEVDPLVRG